MGANCVGRWRKVQLPLALTKFVRRFRVGELLSRFVGAGFFLGSSAGRFVAIWRDCGEGSFALASGAYAWSVHWSSSIVPSRAVRSPCTMT
jgi:hypothetical protein